jgi:tetratricopeptide (TPR) repeat protein
MSNTNLPTKILCVDNDGTVINGLKSICDKHKINCVTATNWEDAIYHFNSNRFDVALVSIQLEGISGWNLTNKWRHHEVISKRDTSFVFSTGTLQKGVEIALATEIGDTVWIQKPIKELALLSILSKALGLKSQREKLSQLKEKIVCPMLAQGDHKALLNLAKVKLPQMGHRGAELAAHVLEQINQIPAAIEQFEGLSKTAPNNMLYVNEIGRLQMLQGDFVKAKAAFEQADKVAPSNIRRLRDMARNYLALNDPEKGLEKYRQLIELDPANPDQKFDFYEELQAFGYDSHAEKFCEDTSTPLELIRHYNNKGVLASKCGEFVDAIDEYKKAQRLIPRSKELYRIIYNEAIAHINLKHQEHLVIALELLEKSIKIKPDFDKAIDKIEKLKALGLAKKAG